jgi:hypothetical protein
LLYPLAVVFLAGTLLPTFAVQWLTRHGWIGEGLTLGSNGVVLGISLVVGFCLIALALRTQLRGRLRHTLRLFIALFAVSLAEVLVFLGILFNLTEVVPGPLVRPLWGSAIATIVSSALFGVYHFHAFDALEQLGTGRSFVRCLAFCMPDPWVDAGYLDRNDHQNELCHDRLCAEPRDDARR